MIDETSKLRSKWQYASKISSWPKLLLPALLGQTFGFSAGEPFSTIGFFSGLLISMLNLLYIVYLNDFGDEEVDKIKRRLFPSSCSKKTVPDGILPAKSLLVAGLTAGSCALGLAFITAKIANVPRLPLLVFTALLVFQAYTFWPIKLNYRGGGEFLEGAGAGILLPLINAYSQCAKLWQPIYWGLGGFFMLSFASALASGLADVKSDQKGGKTTFASRLGVKPVLSLISASLLSAPMIWIYAVSQLHSPVLGLIYLMPSGLIFWFNHKQGHQRNGCISFDDDRIRTYKSELHHTIWLCTVCVIVMTLSLRILCGVIE